MNLSINHELKETYLEVCQRVLVNCIFMGWKRM